MGRPYLKRYTRAMTRRAPACAATRRVLACAATRRAPACAATGRVLACAAALLAAVSLPADARAAGPSRPPVKGCAWSKLSDAALGLEAWVQKCDFGFRKIDFRVAKGSLLIHWSDGGTTEPVIDVLDLAPGETPEAGVRRIFARHTDKRLAARCVLRRITQGNVPAGAQRFTFVPNAAYQKELDARPGDGVPDPPCGDWGEAPDGIQYFETQPASGARKVLFVRVGQDEPLFDEATLRLLPPR